MIHVTKDTVSIRDCLIFGGSPAVEIDPGAVRPDVELIRNYFYMAAPRWYQLREWWRIIQLIRCFSPAENSRKWQ